MKTITIYAAVIIFLLSANFSKAQDKKILVFDPNGVSESFQSTFSQLSPIPIVVADTIDENVNNFDALFLFIDYPYTLSQSEGNNLIGYLQLKKPIYLYSNLYFQNIESVDFWNYIGIDWAVLLLTTVPVDSIVGIDSVFTKDVIIDTSFISPGIPVIESGVVPILFGVNQLFPDMYTTFMSAADSLNVIIDLYRLIHHPEFLTEVINHFNLSDLPGIRVTSPNGGEYWFMGDTKEITWLSNNVDSVKIELSIDNGLLRTTIAESTLSDGLYEWLVQAPHTSWDCRIHITDLADSTIADSSDETFVIDIFPSVDDSVDSAIPNKFYLSQNFPNPFNPGTVIQYTVGNRQYASLKVYDVLGNEVAVLVDEVKEAGTYEVEFDATGLPSGVYFYRLTAGSFSSTKKLILLR